MIGFIIGLVFGTTLGIVVMCLMRTAAEADRKSYSNNDNLPNG